MFKFAVLFLFAFSLSVRAATVIPLPQCLGLGFTPADPGAEPLLMWQSKTGETFLTTVLQQDCSKTFTLANFSVNQQKMTQQAALPVGKFLFRYSLRSYDSSGGPKLALHTGSDLSVFDLETLSVLTAISYAPWEHPTAGNSEDFLTRIDSIGDDHFSASAGIAETSTKTWMQVHIYNFGDTEVTAPHALLPSNDAAYSLERSLFASADGETFGAISLRDENSKPNFPYLLKVISLKTGDIHELSITFKDHGQPTILPDYVEINGVTCVGVLMFETNSIDFYAINGLKLVMRLGIADDVDWQSITVNTAKRSGLLLKAGERVDVYDLNKRVVINSYPTTGYMTCTPLADRLVCIRPSSKGNQSKIDLIDAETGKVLDSAPGDPLFVGLKAIGKTLYVRTGGNLVIFDSL